MDGRKVLLGDGDISALVDADQYDRVMGKKWYYLTKRNKFKTYMYAATNVRDPKRPGKNTLLYLHRFVMDAKPSQHIRFVSEDTLDCRKENLHVRELTSAHNGVALLGRFWQASARKNGEQVYLGSFRTEKEAIDARRRFDEQEGRQG